MGKSNESYENRCAKPRASQLHGYASKPGALPCIQIEVKQGENTNL